MQIKIQGLQTVFMLFYAIFWGAIANAQPRYAKKGCIQFRSFLIFSSRLGGYRIQEYK